MIITMNPLLECFEIPGNVMAIDRALSQPLSLDQVEDVACWSSSSQFFSLPYEILSGIMRYISEEDACTLALVNSDFRRLVRPVQFATLEFSSRNDKQFQLFVDFSNLVVDKHNPTLRIAACVRRLDLVLKGGYLNRDSVLSALPGVISNLAHLKALCIRTCQDVGILTSDLLAALMRSPVAHLKLDRFRVDPDFTVNEDLRHVSWNLQTLDLRRLGGRPAFPVASGPFTQAVAWMLSTCKETLENLWLLLGQPLDWTAFGTLRGEASLLSFPKLRNLRLDESHIYLPVLKSLLSSPALESLNVWLDFGDPDHDRALLRTVNSVELAPSLKVLGIQLAIDIDDGERRHEGLLPFIRMASRNIDKFELTFCDQLHEPQDLFATIVKSPDALARLTSLKLTQVAFTGHQTHVDVLECVSRLKMLEQLLLAIYPYMDSDRLDDDNHPNHDLLRSYLRHLPRLRRFAFDGEDYTCLPDGNRNNIYVEFTHEEEHTIHEYNLHPDLKDTNIEIPTISNYGVEDEDEDEEDEDRDYERRAILFEEVHRFRVFCEARKYKAVLPTLEWTFLGQYPVQFSSAVPQIMTEHRLEHSRWYLDMMFSAAAVGQLHIEEKEYLDRTRKSRLADYMVRNMDLDAGGLGAYAELQ